jgi:uncharacterized protein
MIKDSAFMDHPSKSNPSTSSSRNLQKIMQQHPLFFFFFITYAFSWIISIPFILSEWGILRGNFQLAFVLKGFGPFLTALLMTWILDGKQGIKRLREQITDWKKSWLWYVLVLIAIPLLLIMGIVLQPRATTNFLGLNPLLLVSYFFTYIAVFFGGGPLGEEPGWRGFALPRMQQEHGPLWGTLLLGVLWTCWHLPDFLTSAQGGGPGTGFAAFLYNFPIFLLIVLSFAVLLTWIYNRNHGSIFMTMLAHASINTPQLVILPLFPAVGIAGLNLAALIGFGVPALLIILLTRGRLGYQPGEGLSIAA